MPIHDAITQQIFVPDRLYHGTTDVRLAAIMIDGLRPNYPDKESMLSDYGVYLACDPNVALDMARAAAARHGGAPLVLSIRADELSGEYLMLDFNMPSGSHWSMSVVYRATLTPDMIAVEDVLGIDGNGVIPFNPEPGDPIAFDTAWERADEFIAHADRNNELACGFSTMSVS
jgi:hypothetical protein